MLYVANMIVFNILFFCCNINYKLYLKKGFIIIMILVFFGTILLSNKQPV